MYNPNSPIIANMQQQGQLGVQPQGYTPPVPIGNIGSITGAAGYNGGYYNGIYNNYYNPYLAAKQEEARKAAEKEQHKQASSIMKRISKAAHADDGSEISDERLNELYDYREPEDIPQNDKDWMEMQRLAALPPSENNLYYIHKAYNKAYEINTKYTRPDMTLEEFLEAGHDILVDILEREQDEKRKDLGSLYNKNDYSKLINGNQYSNNMFKKEVTLDDMSVFPSLTQKAKEEYAVRKQAFMAAILANKEV